MENTYDDYCPLCDHFYSTPNGGIATCPKCPGGAAESLRAREKFTELIDNPKKWAEFMDRVHKKTNKLR